MEVLDTIKRLRRRVIVRRGIEYIALKIEEIALFYTENKIVYVIDQQGSKFICDKPLCELENELDHTLFFRANRQYIVNIDFIRVFKPYKKVKLQIDMTLPNIAHKIVVSQETAPSFRKWIYEM